MTALTLRRMMLPQNKYKLKSPYAMTPKYVVIHNTWNTAPAINEANYMISNNNATSFHYVVDEKEAIQVIEENRNAWHSGDGSKGAGNRTGIGIEIARSRSSLDLFKQAEDNGAKLAAWILQRYGWGTDRLRQHKDFANKNCPHRTRELGWMRFVGMVQKYLTEGAKDVKAQVPIEGKCTTATLNIRPNANTSKPPIGQYRLNDRVIIIGVASNGWYQVKHNGKNGYVSNHYVTVTKYANERPKNVQTNTKETNKVEGKMSKKFSKEGLEIIETTPNNIQIVNTYGKNMLQSGYSGINGGLFDTPKPALPASTWCIAVQDGKPIGANSHTNHWKGKIVRATMSYDKNGKVYNNYRNNISEYKEMPIWAIGGVCGLFPTYDPKYEQTPNDILSFNHHTAIAFKAGKIYLIITQADVKCTMSGFRGRIKRALDPDSCIALDGGGSTQLTYDGKSYHTNTRRLSHAIVLREI